MNLSHGTRIRGRTGKEMCVDEKYGWSRWAKPSCVSHRVVGESDFFPG
jgi:hypothetical protein